MYDEDNLDYGKKFAKERRNIMACMEHLMISHCVFGLVKRSRTNESENQMQKSKSLPKVEEEDSDQPFSSDEDDESSKKASSNEKMKVSPPPM